MCLKKGSLRDFQKVGLKKRGGGIFMRCLRSQSAVFKRIIIPFKELNPKGVIGLHPYCGNQLQRGPVEVDGDRIRVTLKVGGKA